MDYHCHRLLSDCQSQMTYFLSAKDLVLITTSRNVHCCHHISQLINDVPFMIVAGIVQWRVFDPLGTRTKRELDRRPLRESLNELTIFHAHLRENKRI